MVDEASAFDLYFGGDADAIAMIGEVVAGDDVPGVEMVAVLGSEFVGVLGYEFPEGLEGLLLVGGLLEEKLVLVEGGGDAAFVFGVLEVDDVVGFYLLPAVVALRSAVLNKLPQALALVLIDNRRPFLVRFLYSRPAAHVLRPRISWGQTPLLGYRRV